MAIEVVGLTGGLETSRVGTEQSGRSVPRCLVVTQQEAQRELGHNLGGPKYFFVPVLGEETPATMLIMLEHKQPG